MITNTGKNILAKYLIGQAPAYASYIAVGCGPKPLLKLIANITHKQVVSGVKTFTTDTVHGFSIGQMVFVQGLGFYATEMITAVPSSTSFSILTSDPDESNATYPGTAEIDFSGKKSLDFEMFRVPIISRGYVNEGGVAKVVMTAELPTEERYEISEIGIYSAGSDSTAGSLDSKQIYSFNQNENWEYHKSSATSAIPSVYEPLDVAGDGVITGQYLINGVSTETPVFQTNADNRIFTNASRIARYENPRFLNNVITTVGDMSSLSSSGGHLVPGNGSGHIHLTGIKLDLNQNSPVDELRLAFSVLNKDGSSSARPGSVKILIEFASSDVDTDSTRQYARFEVDISHGTGTGQNNFLTNRYIVVNKQLQELYKSTGFTWNSVNIVKVWTTVTNSSNAVSSDFYVCLDALKLERTSSTNPLYGLSGYSTIVNADARTITKVSNTANLVEFRFAMDVQ